MRQYEPVYLTKKFPECPQGVECIIGCLYITYKAETVGQHVSRWTPSGRAALRGVGVTVGGVGCGGGG